MSAILKVLLTSRGPPCFYLETLVGKGVIRRIGFGNQGYPRGNIYCLPEETPKAPDSLWDCFYLHHRIIKQLPAREFFSGYNPGIVDWLQGTIAYIIRQSLMKKIEVIFSSLFLASDISRSENSLVIALPINRCDTACATHA